eukprot:3880488-Alexandrium_andersonii.AAC.1
MNIGCVGVTSSRPTAMPVVPHAAHSCCVCGVQMRAPLLPAGHVHGRCRVQAVPVASPLACA